MFLLRAQNAMFSSYVERQMKKKSSLVGFQASKTWMFFGKFTENQVLKSFSGRSNSLKPPVFGFFDSLPFSLEESRE